MNKEEAIEYMKQSVDVKDWNKRREILIQSFMLDNNIQERVLKLPRYPGGSRDTVDVIWKTRIPAWYYTEIEGSGLIVDVLGEENIDGEVVHTTVVVDGDKENDG